LIQEEWKFTPGDLMYYRIDGALSTAMNAIKSKVIEPSLHLVEVTLSR
jgi:hypothetical protein